MSDSATYFRDLSTDLGKIRDKLNSLPPMTSQAATTAEAASVDANADRQALKDLVAQSKQQVTDVRSQYEGTLRERATQLASSIDQVSSSASGVADSLSQTIASLQGTGASTARDLARVRDSLTDGASKLNAMADELDAVHTQVSDALSSGDLERVRQVTASLAAPVGLDRQAVYPVENTGSSMAPYFTTLAIWVGCVILSAMLKVVVPERVLAELGHPKPRHVYVGRFLFFLILSLLQSSLICLGDLVYALTVSVGDVGKAIGVVLMVMQVAGSGGIFPVEVMPGFFQAVYEFLPFVHSMTMFKYAIAGGLPGEYWVAMAKLLAFVVPALLLGLLLRKPVVRLNAWFMRQLESTKVM